jgi:hypothetical protein
MNASKLNTIFRKTFVGVMFFSSSLLAGSGSDQATPEHIQVGARAMTHVDKVKVQEKRAHLFEKVQKGETLAEETDLELSEAEQQEVSEQGLDIEDVAAGSSKLMKKGINATKYYTSHEGAFHKPISVWLLGDAVELEDGSIWNVCSADRYKTLDWMTGHDIIILANHDWFSIYDYRFINLNTGANVKVNLSLGPIYNGIWTHWILAIDYYHREICLEDGSVWKISGLDSAIVNSWLPNDTVIIGVNDAWFSNSNPNMLINVNMNNYAIGKCIY